MVWGTHDALIDRSLGVDGGDEFGGCEIVVQLTTWEESLVSKPLG